MDVANWETLFTYVHLVLNQAERLTAENAQLKTLLGKEAKIVKEIPEKANGNKN